MKNKTNTFKENVGILRVFFGYQLIFLESKKHNQSFSSSNNNNSKKQTLKPYDNNCKKKERKISFLENTDNMKQTNFNKTIRRPGNNSFLDYSMENQMDKKTFKQKAVDKRKMVCQPYPKIKFIEEIGKEITDNHMPNKDDKEEYLKEFENVFFRFFFKKKL